MALSRDVIAQHGLKPDEYQRIVEHLGREPNLLELGIFSVMWSEHCSYKSSRMHLKRFPTTGPRVLQGPGENAGVVDIGDGVRGGLQDGDPQPPQLHRAVPGRGHRRRRHPARRLHHGRAADRARSTRCASATPSHPQTPWLLEGVVAGIGGYGNCIGVPTVGGEVAFDASYNGNILVNAFTVGVLQADRIFKGTAAGRRQPGPLRRREDRPRRHPRRDDGLAPSSTRRARASARPCRWAIRSPRSSCSRRASSCSRPTRWSASRTWARRGSPRRRSRWRAAAGSGIELDVAQGAAAREGHDALRDHALREPGAHAHRRQAGPRGRGAAHLPEVGSRRGGHRPRHRHRPACVVEDGDQVVRRHPGRRRSPTARPSTTGPTQRPAWLGRAAGLDRCRSPPRRHRGAALLDAARLARRSPSKEWVYTPVRPHGAARRGRAPGQATPPWCASSGGAQGPRAGGRLQRALRATSTRTRARGSRWPSARATSPASAASRSASPTA